MSKVLDNFDLSKVNIILCEETRVSHQIINQISKETEDTGIVNYLLFLPAPVTHCSKFEMEFKGKILEYDRPIIFTQSKEFLETILQIQGDIMKIVSSDFNVVQIFFENEELRYKTYSKEEAYHLMIEQGIDLRKISGEIVS